MIKAEFEHGTKGQPQNCECCNFATVHLQSYERRKPPPGSGEVKWLCDLCASTPVGLEFEYRQDRFIQIMQTQCYVGNMIRAIFSHKVML